MRWRGEGGLARWIREQPGEKGGIAGVDLITLSNSDLAAAQGRAKIKRVGGCVIDPLTLPPRRPFSSDQHTYTQRERERESTHTRACARAISFARISAIKRFAAAVFLAGRPCRLHSTD